MNTYLRGQAVTITATFRDRPGGDPQNPEVVAITVRGPDEVVTTLDALPLATGRFVAEFDTSDAPAGVFTVLATGQGGLVAATATAFRVAELPEP